MKDKIYDIFMVIGVISVVYLSFVGIHELGHYVVYEENDVKVRQICLLGGIENNETMSIVGWVASDHHNNTEIDEWHDNWDYIWYGWVYGLFKEEI